MVRDTGLEVVRLVASSVAALILYFSIDDIINKFRRLLLAILIPSKKRREKKNIFVKVIGLWQISKKVIFVG
jgi:hypothetical protein